jgi:hypothetical protein
MTLMEGLKPVDPKALEDYERTMKEHVVPTIVRVAEQRRHFAAERRAVRKVGGSTGSQGRRVWQVTPVLICQQAEIPARPRYTRTLPSAAAVSVWSKTHSYC